MFNAVILPILTSLAATGLGILAVWLYNRKRSDDKIANEIAGITNKIEAVEAKMDNGFDRETLEKDTLLNAFNTAKTEMGQTIEASDLKQREFYQDIIERIHNESVAREEFSRTVKISIDAMEQAVANNSGSIAKLEKTVVDNSRAINGVMKATSNNQDLIERTLNILEGYSKSIKNIATSMGQSGTD